MNSIILLKGKSNEGKSGTLLALIELIKSDPSFTILEDYATSNGNDRFLIAKSQNCTIAVLTPGDPGEEPVIEKHLKICLDREVNLLFCTSRTRGKVLNLYWYFAENHKWNLFGSSPFSLLIGDKAPFESLNHLSATSLKALIPILSAQ